MTDITINVDRNHYHVLADGHSGESTVCAGISALTQMLGGCILNYDDIKNYVFDISDGHTEYEFTSPNWKVLEDVKAMTIGLLQIERSHPQNIRIKQNIL